RGVAAIFDELVGWIAAMDAYRGGKGGDRQKFLSFWSRTLVKINRKTAAGPIIIPRPCLTVVGGVQPDLLGELKDAADRQDGFLDRIVWAYPDPVPDRWTEAEIDSEVTA